MDGIHQGLSVLVVFLLLGAALWTLRRRGSAVMFRSSMFRSTRPERMLERVEKLALTPQHSLHLIRVEGRDIVVATHPQGCTLIESIRMERGAGA